MTCEPIRDTWGRPMLLLPGSDKRVAFTRASTLANVIEDQWNLQQWKMRQVAIGLGCRPDLVRLAQAKPDHRETMQKVVDSAMEAAESAAGANMGTAIHALTEAIDRGQPLPSNIPEDLEHLLEEYRQAMARLEILAVEQFVVCQELQAAGTFDRLVRLPNGVVMIADLKTGTDAWKYAHGHSVQLAVYAHSKVYDLTLDAVLEGGLMSEVDQRRALLIHADQKAGNVRLYWLDIETGWRMARTAQEVRTWHKQKGLATPVKRAAWASS